MQSAETETTRGVTGSLFPATSSAWSWLFGVALLILFNPLQGRAQAAFDREAEVTQALLAQRWDRVADLTQAVGPDDPSIELRLARGHALFALDKDNESYCLIQSVKDTDRSGEIEMLKRWESWTGRLAAEHPGSAVAHHLAGDALARLQQWDAALAAFNRALELDPNLVVALNARAMVHALREEWNDALLDLTKALSLDGDRAASYASLGAFWVIKKDGAKGADDAFTKALAISPDSVAALYGRGCVRSVLGQWSEAQKDLEAASSRAGCLSAALYDRTSQILASMKEAEGMILAQSSDENPSFEVQRRLTAMENSGTTGLGAVDLKYLVTTAGRHPDLAPDIQRGLASVAAKNPGLAANIGRDLAKMDGHNRFGQMVAQTLSGLAVGLSSITARPVVGTRGVGLNTTSVSANLDLKPGMQGWESRITTNLTTIDRFQHSLPAAYSPRGFKTGLDEATWDYGSWPFEALNALLYTKSDFDNAGGK